MFGCILTAGLGQNVARQVGVGAGLPYSVPAYTVGMVCGSGMKSVIEAGRAILAGDADIVVCGGTENMSAAPLCLLRRPLGRPHGRQEARRHHDQGRPVGCLQQLPHGHHRREHLRCLGHHPRRARRLRRCLPAEDRGRAEGRPFRRRDRSRPREGQEGDRRVQEG